MNSFESEIAKKPALPNAVKAFFFESKTRQCTVCGHSMEPFLSFGETVVIVQSPEPLKKGRCYAFITGNTLTIHRFIKKSGGNHALFAGDNNLLLDRVPLPDIIGELSPCQNHGILFIIMIVNCLLCIPMLIFKKGTVFRIIRRRIIRFITEIGKKRNHGNEKKIRKT